MEELRDKTCFFCGHRDISEEKLAALQERLAKTVEDLIGKGVFYFGVGGGVGFDNLAALTVLKLKRRYPQIRLAVVLPCKEHDFSWQGLDKEPLEKVLRQADRVMYTAERYSNGCMYKRNRQLAESSGVCVCYLERDTGGTAYAVSYAQSVGAQVVNLALE